MRDFRTDPEELRRIWARPTGWARFADIDHAVIAQRWVGAGLLFCALALAMRGLGREVPLLAETGVAWAHVALPLLMGAGLWLVPQVMGARDLAFPRLTALAFWLFLMGGGLAAVAPGFRGRLAEDLWLAGIGLLALALLGAAAVLLVSLLILRRPGLGLARIGLLGWAMLAGTAVLVLGMPGVVLGVVLLRTEGSFGLPFLSPEGGGDAGLLHPLFTTLAHPGGFVLLGLAIAAAVLVRLVRAGGPWRAEAVLTRPRHGWRETLGVSPLKGRPEQVVLLPEPTVLPLWVALVIGAAVLAVLGEVWVLAGTFACLAVAIALSFPVHPAASHDLGPLWAGDLPRLPGMHEAERPPLLWGLRVAILADAAGLLALVGLGLFLSAGWERSDVPELQRGLQIVTLASLIGCVATADKALRRGRKSVLDILGAGTWALAVLLTPIAMIQRLEGVTAHAAPALVLVMLVWLSLQGAVGVLLAGIALWRRLRGQVSNARRGDLRLLRLWQRWLAVAGVVAMAYPHLLAWGAA